MTKIRVSKRLQRAVWIMDHTQELKQAMTLLVGSTHNAAHNGGMSTGGWGYWEQAFKLAHRSYLSQAMSYWSGSAPTPSTAINRGVAAYISLHGGLTSCGA